MRLTEITKGNVDAARALVEAGWNVTRLGALVGEADDILEEICLKISGRLAEELTVRQLKAIALTAEGSAKMIWRTEGATNGSELLVASELKKMEERLNYVRNIQQEMIAAVVPRKGTAVVTRWPTRREKRISAAGDNAALREGVERSERERWIDELRHLLYEAKLPSMFHDLPIDHVDPSLRFGKGRRASTLRKHVKTWMKARDWMMKTFGYPWPKHPEELALYLEARANEPCGKTVPGSIFKTFIFMEVSGEVEPEWQMHKAPALRNVLEELAVRMERTDAKFTKKAWHLPVKAVAAMERAVMDEELTRFVRAYAWFRLMKLWAGLRFSDTKGLAFNSVRMEDYGLMGVLSVTKTTGPGKKVALLRAYVSAGAWLVDSRWLEAGWAIWGAMSAEKGFGDRDFFLPMPSMDLEGIVRRMCHYYTAAQMSQALFSELEIEDMGRRDKLLEAGVGTVWTEHSERVTLRTWAAASGVPDRVMKLLGRWSPSVDQGYERQMREEVLSAQEHTAEFVKKKMGGADPFDESLVLQAVVERMDYLGYNDEEIRIQVEKLRTFGAGRAEESKRRKREDLGFEDWIKVGQERLDRGLDADDERPDEEAQASGDRVAEPDSSDEEVEEAVKVPLGHYVVSVVGRSNTRTLHRVGECFRRPGEHYARFDYVGNEPPNASKFHRACKVCFPKGGVSVNTADDDSQSGEEEVSSSDSSVPPGRDKDQ